MKKLFFAFIIVAAAAGCKKDSTDTTAPVITLTSPTDGQAFTAGQTVHVTANISDNDEIHEVHLYVTNVATGDTIANFEEHLDAGSYTLDQTFAVQAGVSYKIEVDANDHSNNEAQKILHVSAHS